MQSDSLSKIILNKIVATRTPNLYHTVKQLKVTHTTTTSSHCLPIITDSAIVMQQEERFEAGCRRHRGVGLGSFVRWCIIHGFCATEKQRNLFVKGIIVARSS